MLRVYRAKESAKEFGYPPGSLTTVTDEELGLSPETRTHFEAHFERVAFLDEPAPESLDRSSAIIAVRRALDEFDVRVQTTDELDLMAETIIQALELAGARFI